MGDPLDRSGALLGRLNQACDAAYGCGFAGFGGADFDYAFDVHRSGEDLVPDLTPDRHGLADNARLVHRSGAGHHQAVGGNPVAFPNQDHVSFGKLACRRFSIPGVRLEPRDVRRQLEQTGNGVARRVFSKVLEHLAEIHHEGDYGRRQGFVTEDRGDDGDADQLVDVRPPAGESTRRSDENRRRARERQSQRRSPYPPAFARGQTSQPYGKDTQPGHDG